MGKRKLGESVATLDSPNTVSEIKQSKDTLMSKFTWRIENFSHLNAKELYSVSFVVNDYKWSLLLFPKGNKTDHLSLYLGVADSSCLSKDWSITTKFSIALINQIDSKKTIKKEAEGTFSSQNSEWGYQSFIPLSIFHDKVEGYIVNDTCLIEAEVYVNDDVSSPSTDKDLDSSVACDHVESVFAEVQSFLKSLPKKPSISLSNATCATPLFKGHAIYAKECFDKLIKYPLDDLADPKHEYAMMQSLVILAENLSLFGDEKAKEVMNLKATFPEIMQEWRDSIEVKGSSVHLWTTFEKAKSLLEDLVKTEDGIKTKLEGFNKKAKDLESQLEVIKRISQTLKEEREEVSKKTKIVCSLAKEQASKIEGKEVEVDGANKKLEDLKSKWDATRCVFA